MTRSRRTLRARAMILLLVGLAAVGVPRSSDAAPPIKPIQPGGVVRIGGASCTLNFVFRSGSTRYVGTAGHCASVGARAIGDGDLAFGTVVFSRYDAGLDFALIRVDDEDRDQIEPAVRAYGGPSGITGLGEASTLDRVGFYGFGLGFGISPATRARQGVLTAHGTTHFQMDAPAVNGDSGAPVIHLGTGKAVGIVSEYGLNEFPPSTDVGPTIRHILNSLANANYSVSLMTAAFPG